MMFPVKYFLRVQLFIVLFLGLNTASFSFIEVSYSGFGYVLGPHGEPTIGCEVWATYNGQPLVLTHENTKLIQSKVAIVDNLNISAPSPSGHQTFTWGLKIGLPHNVEFELLVTNNSEIGSANLHSLPEFDGYNLACYDVDEFGSRRMIQRLDFTNNDNTQAAYLFLAGSTFTSGPIPTQPFIDSITCTNPDVAFTCWPYPPAAMPPPTLMWYSVLYKLEAIYNEPAGHPYMRDWLILHLAGGVKYRFEIMAHEPKIENKPLLQLISPQGGEHYSPCEEVLIQWQGHNPTYPTSIEFSPDGERWSLIRNIPGDSNTYLWKVPDTVISDYCFIRVSQKQYNPERKMLRHDDSTVRSAVFNEINNNIANKILTASSANNIVEWDIAQSPVAKLTAINTGDSTDIIAAIYTSPTRIVALDAQNNALLYCNTGDVSIQKSAPLPTLAGFVPRSMKCDYAQRFILLQPQLEYGNTLMFVDTAGNYITKLTENLPFTAVHLSDNKIYYALIDNTIKSVSLARFPDFTDTEQFYFAKDYNIINAISVSKDDNMVAVSCRQQLPKDVTATLVQQGDNLIFDKRLGTGGMIFRNLKTNTHANLLLDFSPAGTIAITACANSPQIMFTDLTNYTETQWRNDPIRNLQGVTVSRACNALIAYSGGNYNTTYIPFALPEWQMNTRPFSIVAPQLSLAAEASARLTDVLIGTVDTVVLPLQLCNTGLSKIEITQAQFENIEHLELDNSKMSYPIVLQPGECTTLYIIAHPRDTGLLAVPLQFVDTCDLVLEIPFYIRGIDRRLTLYADTIDFGTNCINDTITLADVALFRNDDTVDVVINDIVSYYANFAVSGYSRDTVLRPGESFVATLTFLPGFAVDSYLGEYIVYYAGQWAVVRALPARARTVGIDWAVSHPVLSFVPEAPSRTFTFTNTGTADVTINSLDIAPAGSYSTSFVGPAVVLPGDSLQITVTCNAFPAQDASLMFITAPCLSGRNIVSLTAYSGTANVWIPALRAEPHNSSFDIPVYFKQRGDVSYGGPRIFEAVIELRSSLFWPNSVRSPLGVAELVSTEVVGSARRIHFKVTGDFSSGDSLLALINGVVMLGDSAFTSINWGAGSALFGQNVASVAEAGSLEITLSCEGRFAGAPANSASLRILSVSPLPAEDLLTVGFEVSKGNSNVNDFIMDDEYLMAYNSPPAFLPVALALYDLSGGLLLKDDLLLGVGHHSETLDISGLAAGSYILSIFYEGQYSSFSVVKY